MIPIRSTRLALIALLTLPWAVATLAEVRTEVVDYSTARPFAA